MYIGDVLIYYFTAWFNRYKEKLKEDTPLNNATYILSLTTGFWIITIWESASFFILKSKTAPHIPLIPGAIATIGIWQLYNYVYLKRGRYKKIKPLFDERFKMSETKAIILAMVFVMISLFVTFGIFMIFTQ